MSSSTVASGSGRTSGVLTTQPREGAPPHAAPQRSDAAIARGEGVQAPEDGPLATVDERLEIARASTRFEVRLSPKNRDGSPHEANLALLKQLDEASSLVAKVRNRVTRWCFRRDGDWLDEQPAPLPQRPGWAKGPVEVRKRGAHKGKEMPAPLATMAYREAIRSPECARLSSEIVASISNDAVKKWVGSRWRVLVAQTEAVPHYKQHQPIPVPRAAVKLRANSDGSASVSFRILSGKAEGAGRMDVSLVPRSAWQRQELRCLTSGEWKVGHVVLSRHPVKRGRWFVRISYTKRVDRARGDATVAVRRGMKAFLVAAASDGTVKAVYPGGDMVAFKLQMDARRRSLSRHARSVNAGRAGAGHGSARRNKPLEALADKESRYCKAVCRRAAEGLAQFAKFVGASRVILEDFVACGDGAHWLIKRWPWHDLKAACKQACENAGLAVTESQSGVDRRLCPSCGHAHESVPADSHGVWRCAACGMARTVDQVDALIMLKEAGADGAPQRAERRRKEALRTLARGGAAAGPPDPLASPGGGREGEGRTAPGPEPPASKAAG